MGRVLTNNTSFRYAIEATEVAGSRGIGFLPGEDPGDGGAVFAGAPVWKDIEPNDPRQFGSTVETVARNPIRRSRGRQKGTISGLTSGVAYDADVTVDSFLDYIEGFLFSTFSNGDLIFRGSDVTGNPTDDYTVAALNAAQAAKLQSDANVDTIVYASGYRIAANNGLKVLNAAASASDVAISVEDTLTTETAQANARLEIAGARLADGEMDLTVAARVANVSGRIGTLTFANANPTSFGLQIGQIIFVDLTSTVRGYARITDITATTLVIDKMDAALVASAPTGATTRILFGQFLRDVGTDQANFLERSFQFEAEYPGLAADGLASAYEYARGNFCSTLQLSADTGDKALIAVDFIGTDTDVPTETRKVVASVSPANALAPLGTEAFSTVSDFARLRIDDIDEDGLTTDLKSIEMTIDNNVSPEEVLNKLGARFINFGNFFVDMAVQIVFTDGAVLSRIRENTTVSLDMFFQNNDGVLAFNVPSMTLGDGSKELPTDETVLMNISGEAFEDPVTGASLNVSLIPSVPA